MRFFVLLLAAASLHADVSNSSPGGFTVTVVTPIHAAPDVVYHRFIKVGEWWNPQHTYSQDAHNLSIEPKVNGCFCEKLPNGGGVRHLQIVYLEPNKAVRLVGGLGPFQVMSVNGVMTIEFAPANGATKFSLTYNVGGYFEKGLNTVAPMADGMLKEQVARLKSYIETGSPVPAAK